MRRVRHFPLSIFLLAVSFCAAALALPPKAEAAIHLGDSNTVLLSNGLVGYWPLDGNATSWATGKTSDLSGQGNSGQLRSMSTSTSVTKGKTGQALFFDGVSSYVDAGNASAANFGTSNFAIAFWVNSKPGSDGYVITKRSACGNGSFWNAYITGETGFPGLEIDEDAGGTNYNSIDGDVSVQDGKWHHVVFTRVSVTLHLYIDGKLDVDSPGGGVTNISNSASLVMGDNNPCGSPYPGSLDDIRIYNRALSAAEVKQLYNLGSAKTGGAKTFAGGSLSSGLVGYWPLDGDTTSWTSNTTADLSGNGNTGSLTLMSTTSSPVGGKIGQGLLFDGSQRYINVGDVSALQITNTITLTAWVKFTSLPSTNNGCGNYCGVIIEKGYDGATEGYLLRYFHNGGQTLIQTGSYNGSNHIAQWVFNFGAGTWHFVVGQYDGVRWNIYADGSLVASTEDAFGPLSTAAPVSIGAASISGTVGRFFPGVIDDARIYNRALSASEVMQLYKSGAATIGNSNPIISNGLVGYWPLDGDTTSWTAGKTYDRSGNGNDGSLALMSTSSSPTAGKIGQALTFDRSKSQAITPSTNLQYQPPFSFSVWLQAADIPSGIDTCNNYYPAIAADSASGQGYGWGIAMGSPTGNGYNHFELNRWGDGGGAWFGTTSNATYVAGRWYHVAGVYASSTAYLYINGALDKSQDTPNGPIYYGGSASSIGSEGCGAPIQYFNGKIDDVRIYNRALSAAEVKQLYNAGR
jgi:Concanavalin A-like lectin/glucanases superfamily